MRATFLGLFFFAVSTFSQETLVFEYKQDKKKLKSIVSLNDSTFKYQLDANAEHDFGEGCWFSDGEDYYLSFTPKFKSLENVRFTFNSEGNDTIQVVVFADDRKEQCYLNNGAKSIRYVDNVKISNQIDSLIIQQADNVWLFASPNIKSWGSVELAVPESFTNSYNKYISMRLQKKGKKYVVKSLVVWDKGERVDLVETEKLKRVYKEKEK